MKNSLRIISFNWWDWCWYW